MLSEISVLLFIFRGGFNWDSINSYSKSLFYYQKVPDTSFEIYNSNKWCLQANIYIRSNKIDSARYCLSKIKVLKGMETDYHFLILKHTNKNSEG